MTLRAVAPLGSGGSNASLFNSSAFASLPAAASSTGLVYSVSDLGGALFRSNGTRWLPASGPVVVYSNTGSLASPLATISSSTAAQFSITGGFPSIPASLLAAQSRLRVSGLVRRNGANGTAAINVRLGTAGTTGDSIIETQTLTAVDNRQLWFLIDGFFSSTTSVTTVNFLTPNTQGNASITDRSTNINTASAMTVSVDISSANAADSFNLVSLVVEAFP